MGIEGIMMFVGCDAYALYRKTTRSSTAHERGQCDIAREAAVHLSLLGRFHKRPDGAEVPLTTATSHGS